MGIYKLNPLQDPRWQNFVDMHPKGSVFHGTAWLQALQQTYGYDPVVYSTTPPGQDLSNGLVFCRIRSWVSGSRLVSLPFSDHCEPLAEGRDLAELLEWLAASRQRKQWKYIELRPLSSGDSVSTPEYRRSESFLLQVLDVSPNLDALFRKFHKSCVQRKIQRADREGLTYEEGRSQGLLKKFYELLVLTRRRHGLPPQPFIWFRNAAACLGDKFLVRLASKDGRPIAGIVTIQNKDVLVYKYGGSDSRFNNLGGNAFLFWKAIQDAKKNGLRQYDMGRSEIDNSGLITFKENWGAENLPLHYFRIPARQPLHLQSAWRTRLAKGVFSMMPDSLLTVTGRLLYRHIG